MSVPRSQRGWTAAWSFKWGAEPRVFPLHCSTFEHPGRHGPWHEGTPVTAEHMELASDQGSGGQPAL